METIIFKAKTISNGEYVYGDLINCALGETYIHEQGKAIDKNTLFHVDPNSVEVVNQ